MALNRQATRLVFRTLPPLFHEVFKGPFFSVGVRASRARPRAAELVYEVLEEAGRADWKLTLAGCEAQIFWLTRRELKKRMGLCFQPILAFSRPPQPAHSQGTREGHTCLQTGSSKPGLMI